MFVMPEDITVLSAEDLATLADSARSYAEALVRDEASTVESLTMARDAVTAIAAEKTRRAEASAALEALRGELSTAITPEPAATPALTETVPPAPAATSAAPAAVAATAGQGGRPTATLDTPPDAGAPRYAVLTASSDAPGPGAVLDFTDAAKLIADRITTYSSSVRSNPRNRPIAPKGPGSRVYRLSSGRSVTRHGGVAIRREYPRELQITETGSALSVLEHAARESRLPGGSLARSAQLAVQAGRSLTAAAGWCAPSETIYDLAQLEVVSGILDLPEVQATRGGFFAPVDGGPDFGSIFEGIGDSGDVVLSEYDVENDATKVCVEIPCPEFSEVRLDVAYACITGSLLQSRGFPEAVTRFTQGALVALVHKINMSVIARIVAASGPAVNVPTILLSDDAASQILGAVDLAAQDIRSRNRMDEKATIEVVLPSWVISPIRAALSRRRGVLAIDVSDAEVMAAFTTRNVAPRFVYDWQDAFSGLVGGPGGATPITRFPTSVQFLAYPAGTWTKIVRSVINLDTVYDSTLLTQNQYTALFVEDGFNVLQMGPDSRLYDVEIDPAGIVGCCDGGVLS